MRELLSSIKQDKTKAHVVPFALFMGFLFLLMLVGDSSLGFIWKHADAPWWRRYPEHWLYPLQSLIVISMLWYCRKQYEFKWEPSKILFGAILGAVGIGFWILPSITYDLLGLKEDPDNWMKWLGIIERDKGFDPRVFGNTAGYWSSLTLRMFRAVVVVSLVEEIFWRGFLMRFLLKPDGNYWKVPFGTFAWKSYLIVTAAFVSAHQACDRPAALIYGTLAYYVTVKTKSLSAVVAMHAVANFIMGWYAVSYDKLGLW